MRGKHASAAERRRYLQDVESRAVTAERSVAALTTELGQVQEKAARQLASLTNENRNLRIQRDQQASPLLDQAEQRIRDLMAAIAERDKQDKVQYRKQKELIAGIFALLELLGFSRAESMEILAASHGELVTMIGSEFGTATRRNLSSASIRQIQAARGHRSNSDLVREIQAALADGHRDRSATLTLLGEDQGAQS